MDEGPTITILLLGSAECGKSTFLSCLSQGRDLLSHPSPSTPRKLPMLRDMDQPFTFEIRMYNRPYRFEFFDTASPTNYTLLLPDMVVLCYDISSRESLHDVQDRWRKEVLLHYRKGQEEKIPVVLVGLKRDLRDVRVAEGRDYLDPMEAYRIAQEMRCDRYAECSALTGELVSETFEDIARIAAMTTTESGGLSQGAHCLMM